MNLSVLLLTCVFVRVLGDMTEYMNAVSLTNGLMELASEFKNDVVRSKNVGNGLEYVIKSIVLEEFFTMNRMNYMIAIPDYAPLTNEREIIDAIGHQRVMRIEICLDLRIHVENATKRTYNYENSNLTSLGESRRLLTGKALKNIIKRILATNEPGITSCQMCIFIGLWISTTTPAYYTKTTDTDHNGNCTLTNRYGNVIKYKSFDGMYWRVANNDTHDPIMSLKEELESIEKIE